MKKRILMSLILLLILIVGFVGAKQYQKTHVKAQQNSVQTNKTQVDDGTLKMIVPNNIEDIAFLYDFANDKGFFEKNNLNIQKIDASKDFMTIMASGGAEVYIGTYSGSISSYLNNVPMSVLANLMRPFDYFGLSRFPKENFSSIKKVAVNGLAGDPPIAMKAALRNIGVNPDTVEMVANPSQDARVQMLEKGDIDFTIIPSQKFVDDNKLEGKFTTVDPSIVASGTDSLREITVMQKTINTKPQTLQRFVLAMYQTLNLIKSSPDETKQYVAQKYGFDAQQADFFYQRLSDGLNGVSFVPDANSMTPMAENLKKTLNINSDRDLNNLVDADFAKQASSSN